MLANNEMSADEILYSQVLFVEDIPEVAKANLRWLTREGLSVDYADSFQRAVELITRKGARYEAAILDHELPDGDSRELVSMLNDHEPTCSSLVLTAHDGRELIRQYRGRGAFRFLKKPIKGLHLLSHVHATIVDSHRWRNAGNDDSSMPEPPKIVLDIEAAADRLRYICGLTPTEREVAYWLLLGVRDAKLAQVLGRAERTAKRHVSEVLRKAGVPNRAALWSVLRNDGAFDSKPGDDHDAS